MACIAVLAAGVRGAAHGQGGHLDVSMVHGLHAQLVVPRPRAPCWHRC